MIKGALDEGVESIEASGEAGNAQPVNRLIVTDKLLRYGADIPRLSSGHEAPDMSLGLGHPNFRILRTDNIASCVYPCHIPFIY